MVTIAHSITSSWVKLREFCVGNKNNFLAFFVGCSVLAGLAFTVYIIYAITVGAIRNAGSGFDP